METTGAAPQGFYRKHVLGKHYMFWVFIVCYTVIHINFEYRYWFTGDRDIFGKYELAEKSQDKLEVAKEVYFSKATWMFALVILTALGLNFRAAMAFSFSLYSIELMFLFPVNTYNLLNLLLASGLLIEQGIEWKQRRGGE